ncbi:MAG: DUF4397 domain-containing protein [Lachnospiraceae bacterium]|nr:DUF4397 domain-containing protein [Lachnospiraceae bacterium]
MNDNGATPIVPLPNPGEGGPVFPGNDFGSCGNGDNNNNGGTPVIPLPNPGEGGPVFPGNNNNVPVIPLPNPGEGGPVFPGNNNNVPVIPLPNPGEGGPVYPGNNNNVPVIPLPNPGEGGPVYPGNNNVPVRPVIPLPNPGEGGPVFSGNNSSGFQGTIITVLPRPVTPCFYCNSNSYGTIRFLNAAIGYNPFVVSVNNRTAVDTLEYAEVSDYGRISSGYQTITVSGRNGYIYITKQIRVTVGATMTIAIVNTAGGLNLVEINDAPCYTPMGGSCIRVSNLSYNAGPLTLSTYSGNIVFRNVQFMEVTNYVRVVPARYEIFVSNQNEALLSTEITARSNSQYTIYMFNWNESPTAIRTLIIEDRR